MTTPASVQTLDRLDVSSIQEHINSEIDSLFASMPDAQKLSAEQRRGIIARYASVLEGNFIYWMTAALLSVKSEEARLKIIDNLREEVRDCHPGMLRRFVMAANAVPTQADGAAVYKDMSKVRLFMGKLSGVPIVITMAFFEGFIQRFMALLADLAERQGSAEKEYTDVHGICDITHTEELYQSLAAEIALDPPEPKTNIFEGVDLLRTLIQTIIHQTAAGSNGAVPVR